LVLPGFSDKEKCKTAEHSCKKAVASVSLETLASSRQLAKKAEKHYAAKQVAEAVALYRKVLEMDPEHPTAHARLGYMLVGTGDYEAATKHFKHEIAAGRNPEVATYNMACAASLSGDTKHAVKLLHKAVALGFGNTDLMVKDPDLAAIREYDGFKKAVQLAEKAVQLRAEMSGKVKKGGDPMEALGKQHELVQIVSADGSLQADFGLLLLKAGKPEKAVHAFQRQAELGHDTARACYNLACAQALTGDKKAALASLEKSVKLGMGYAGVVDDPDLASLHGDPTFEKLQVALCAAGSAKKKVKAALAAGDHDAAMKALAKIADCPTSPESSVAWASFELGKLLLDADRPEDSIKSFHRAMNAGYALDQGAFQLAASYAALGEEEQAMSHLHHALDLGFADPMALEKMMQDCALGRDGSMGQLVDRAKIQASKSKKKKLKEGELKKVQLKEKQHVGDKKVGKEIASVD
jgi:tetratricopeptide (TPR) repeat protein